MIFNINKVIVNEWYQNFTNLYEKRDTLLVSLFHINLVSIINKIIFEF